MGRKEPIKKEIDLNELPRWESGANKGKIDWSRSKEYKIKFIYGTVRGYFEILDYNIIKQDVRIRYNDKDFQIKTSSIQRCKMGNIIGIMTKNFKVEIGATFKNNKRDITIIDREYRKNKNHQNCKFYKYKCNKCGWDEGWIVEFDLLKGNECACCTNQIVVEGINDIPTTAPWMIKYFQGGYNEAKLYSKTSNKKIYPICPDCGRIKKQPISISNIYANHSIGCICGDGKSYPEKLMFNILEQLLKDNFETQKMFEWSKNFQCNNIKLSGKKIYDFYFKINGEKYIIETNGRQHYNKCFFTVKSKTLEEEKENDRLKKELAIRNGIKEKNYIVIDCRYSELEYIKSNILKSKLNEVFNLNKINWIECGEFACVSLIKQICDLWNNLKTINEINEITKLSNNTIKVYLKKGEKIGLCNYIYKHLNKSSKNRYTKIKVQNKDGISEIFNSVKEIENKSIELFGEKLLTSKIYDVLKGKIKLYKNFKFSKIE